MGLNSVWKVMGGKEEGERGRKMGQGQEGTSRNVRDEGDMDQCSLQQI